MDPKTEIVLYKEGPLQKKASKLLGGYQKGYFVLINERFFFFPNKNNLNYTWIINLRAL